MMMGGCNKNNSQRCRAPPIFGSSLQLLIQKQRTTQEEEEDKEENKTISKEQREQREDCQICIEYSQVSYVVFVFHYSNFYS
jgi:hypothetical protein